MGSDSHGTWDDTEMSKLEKELTAQLKELDAYHTRRATALYTQLDNLNREVREKRVAIRRALRNKADALVTLHPKGD